jgi:hypothetical protein
MTCPARTARVLAVIGNQWRGKILFVGQSAEELGSDTMAHDAGRPLPVFSGTTGGIGCVLNCHNAGWTVFVLVSPRPRGFIGVGFRDARGERFGPAPVVTIPAEPRISHKDH